MSQSSWQGAFQKVAAAHGVVTGLRKQLREYVEYCDAHPGGGGCSSTRKMDEFFLRNLGVGVREVAGVSRDAPLAVGSPKNFRASKTIGCRGSNIFIRGMDLMTVISTVGSVWPIGTRVAFEIVSLLSPVFAGTRVQWLSNGFEKWKLKKLRFHYQPVCAATTGGALLMAWDNDPADPPVAQDIGGIKELYSYESNVSAPVWQAMSLDCKLHPSTESLFTSGETGGDARLFAAGSLQIASTASPPINTGLGVVWVEYEIEFLAPSELLLAAADKFFVQSRNTAVAYNNTQSLVTQFSGGGFDARSLNTQLNPITGLSGVVLPSGTWMVDVALNNQTTAVAVGLTLAVNTLAPPPVGSIGTVVSDCIDVATPAGNGSGLVSRVWVHVPVGGLASVEPVINPGGTFSNGYLRIRDCQLGSAASPPTQQQVGLYQY